MAAPDDMLTEPGSRYTRCRRRDNIPLTHDEIRQILDLAAQQGLPGNTPFLVTTGKVRTVWLPRSKQEAQQ